MARPTDQKFRQIVAQLEAKGMITRDPPSLDPMNQALQNLNFFESRYFRSFQEDPRRTVVIAGTNGKGSVGATLEALLMSAGQKVGFFSSPHLLEPTERIRVNSVDISQQEFASLAEHLLTVLPDASLSFFEILTLMAVKHFGNSGVDYAIFEVGMGGRWDPTNAIPHGISIITRLGMDHQARLGRTLEAIAENKMGVVQYPLGKKPHKVICSDLEPECLLVADRVRAETRSEWSFLPRFQIKTVRQVNQGVGVPKFILQSHWGEAPLALPGKRGAQNASLALMAFEKMGFDPGQHLTALDQVRWKGRMSPLEIEGVRCPVYFSGDHNPQGLDSFAELLTEFRYQNIHLVIGLGVERPMDEMMEKWSAIRGARIYLTQVSYKGRGREQFESWVPKTQGFFESPRLAIEAANRLSQVGDMIVVTGSLYLLADILKSGQ